MAIFKRGRVYWYHFVFNGQHVQESTKQGNPRVARQMEAAHRTALAKGEVGIRERKPVPTLAEFMESRFEPWARATFEKTSPKTWFDYYRVRLRAIRTYKPLASLKLDQITSEKAAEFAAHRQSQRLQVSTVNSSLQVLRRVLRLAVEWGVIQAAPRIKLLVLPPTLGSDYVGERSLWVTARHARENFCGSADAASDPESAWNLGILEARWQSQGQPQEGWVWPAPTRSGHLESSSLKKQHSKALKASGVRPFVLYSLRHTFLTRLGQSGCDAWTLARIAGHSSIAMSARYVHPSEDAVLSAMARLQAPDAAPKMLAE